MAGKRFAVGLWLAGLAACIALVTQARFVADLSSFLPSAPTPEQRLLVDQLRDGAVSRMVLMGIEGTDAATRARLSHALAARLRDDRRFAFVGNGAGAGFERERGLLLDYRYVLSPNVTAERFTVPGLQAAIGETLEGLASPAGLLLKSLVPRDPTGEFLAVLDRRRAGRRWSKAHGRRRRAIARS